MRIPSMHALRALESFARHNTIWQAAAELNVTRSAISHQLRLLERELGLRLVRHVGRRIELTPQGRDFANDVRAALWAIAGSVGRNTDRSVTGRLTVSSDPFFAASWLCDRLKRFTDAYPGVSLTLVTPSRPGDVTDPHVDLFITFSDGNLPDMDVEHLFDMVSAPLCSPALAHELGDALQPKDLLRAELLHLSDHSAWAAWFKLSGLDPKMAARGVVFSDMYLVYAAAQAGQGFALGHVLLSEDSVNKGKLLRPFAQTIRQPSSYFIAIPHSSAANPVASVFHEWLRFEAGIG